MVRALLAAALPARIAVRTIGVRRRRLGQAMTRARRRAERRELRDPGRERRAEQRARELLRSCVNDEEWSMYRDLGFIRVRGGLGTGGPDGMTSARRRRRARPGASEDDAVPGYAYLIYPHKPIVAYVPQT